MVQDKLSDLHTFVIPYIIYEKQVYHPFPNLLTRNLQRF